MHLQDKAFLFKKMSTSQPLILESATGLHMKNREAHEIYPKQLNHTKAFFKYLLSHSRFFECAISV